MKFYDTEIVFRGHHDKLADQLSDGILQYYLQHNPEADINIDVVGGEGTVFVTGNIGNCEILDITKPVKAILKDLNYDTNILIVDNTSQCNTFKRDATSVYGYATNETKEMLPKSMLILQDIAKAYDLLCKENPIFLPDGKAVMVGGFKDDMLIKIKSININHQNTGGNTEFIKGTIYGLVTNITRKYGVEVEEVKVNPYGAYYKGGFDRDTGLTGSKFEIDSYQGLCHDNKFVISGKSIYGIRAGVYQARELAKKVLLATNCTWCEVKADYEENAKLPHLITITTNTGEIKANLDIYNKFQPVATISDLDLINKDYVKLASYGQIQE